MSWYIDDPRDRLLILFGLALIEFHLKSKDFEGYPAAIKYEILTAVAELTDRLTKVIARRDHYGNPY